MKLIFHVGAPKTATTSLQHALKDHREPLLAQGISYVPTGKLRNSDFGQDLRDETPSFWGGRVSRAAVRKFVNTWSLPGANQLLISDEGYTAYLMHPRRHGSWASQADRTFKILKHFDRYDFRVVLTIRRQDTYLLSCYAHLVRHGRVTLDFDKFWRDGLDLETMSWLSLIEAFHKEYGADRVTVLPFERIREGFATYFRSFAEHGCRLPADRVAGFEPESNELNLALSAPAMDIALTVNRHLRKKMATPQIKDLIRDIKAFLPPTEFPKFKPDVDPMRAAMAARFAEENRTVNRTYLADAHKEFEF